MEEEQENIYKHTKQLVLSIQRNKRQLKSRLNELERLEKEILLVLSNSELAEEILKGSDKE